MTQDEGTAQIDAQMRLMRQLGGHLKLDREIEYLQAIGTCETGSSTGEGMSRPELAIPAYAKMALYDDLLASDLPDEARLGTISSGTSRKSRSTSTTGLSTATRSAERSWRPT